MCQNITMSINLTLQKRKPRLTGAKSVPNVTQLVSKRSKTQTDQMASKFACFPLQHSDEKSTISSKGHFLL